MQIKRFLILLFLITNAVILISADNPPPITASLELQDVLSKAFFQRLQESSGNKPLTFDLFTPELDTAFTSPDGKTAVLWLALRDDRGHLLATEPGLALATLSEGTWLVSLPGDPGWEEMLSNLPAGMLPLEQSPEPANVVSSPVTITTPLYGYYLPYAGGTSRWLEGSISHFQTIPELGYPSCTAEYCQYAYDFTDSWHFPLLAAKGGTVYASRDSCVDGSETCTNYIVLRNASEGTYQIYLHMAHGTIPDKLTNGTVVVRGQYLGDSDDTGYSTSQHVHFMVTNSVWVGVSDYYWGRSIDIRFTDVSINNGIPRTCYEVTHFTIYDGATDCLGDKEDPTNPANDWFTSGNTGAFPPTGTLTRPAAGITVTPGSNPLMDVTATTSDDVSVTAVRLVAKLNEQWVEIGPRVTQPAQPGLYDWDVNLCDVGQLNGPLDVALRVWDYEGNVASALNPRTINVDYACPATSQLLPAETFNSTAVLLNWEVTNVGLGFGTFNLQWRTEPGTWSSTNMFTFPISQRSFWFTGQQGGVYAFRLQVLDDAGRAESWPAGDLAETTASLPATCDADHYEEDDDFGHSNSLVLEYPEQHNLCGPDDADWFQINLHSGKYYLIRSATLNGGAAERMTLYANDGSSIRMTGMSPGVGQDAIMLYNSDTTGSYYIKVVPLLPNLVGTDAQYEMKVSEVDVTFLPVIHR